MILCKVHVLNSWFLQCGKTNKQKKNSWITFLRSVHDKVAQPIPWGHDHSTVLSLQAKLSTLFLFGFFSLWLPTTSSSYSLIQCNCFSSSFLKKQKKQNLSRLRFSYCKLRRRRTFKLPVNRVDLRCHPSSLWCKQRFSQLFKEERQG